MPKGIFKTSGAGCTDLPAVADQFKIEKYINGLASFILHCDTPMTIAIQGDWGTGKTSVMQMVQHCVRDEDAIQDIWFNTWQFSQFDLGGKLPLMLMGKLLRSVGDKPNLLETAGKLAGKIAGVAGDALLGYLSAGATNADGFRDHGDDLRDTVDKIDKLKDDFQTLINSLAGESGRVVIFVDDLDRLQPGKAVELLEVLKNFLDCKNCVFVLAIDYSVVSRGVKEKYGADFSDAKGRSFFDKIIQVPFKMPVASYDIKSYVQENLKQIGVSVRDDTQLKLFISLIESSIGNNPRSMKRLFNSFLLLRNIADDSVTADPHNEEILFALLCMQSRYEPAYNYLMKERGRAVKNLLDLLDQEEENESNQEDVEKPFFVKAGMGGREFDVERREFPEFARIFYGVIADRNGRFSEGEQETLQKVLDFSSTTATGSTGATAGPKARGSETVNDVDELRMRFRTREEKLALRNWILSAGPNAFVKMVNANSGYSFFSGRVNENGPEFTYIRDLKSEWRIHFEFHSKTCLKSPEAHPALFALAHELDCTIYEDVGELKLKTPINITDERVTKLLRIAYDMNAGREIP